MLCLLSTPYFWLMPAGRAGEIEGVTILRRMTLRDLLVDFALRHFESVEDLRVFITCVDYPHRWWNATAVADHLSIEESGACAALERFTRGNLLDIRVSDDVRYRFKPGTEELEAQAWAFAAAFRHDPVAVVQFVSRSATPDSVRDFADAFRIKRHDDR